MKIFMLIKRLRYSGAYKMFMWVAKALADRGYDVTVFTYMRSDVEKLPSNIRWIQADLEDAGIRKRVGEVRHYMEKCGADVSISFLLDANIINTLACLGLKTKSIICERNDPYKPHYYKLQLTKWMFRFADGAVFQLPKVADYYSMIRAYCSYSQSCGFDLEKWRCAAVCAAREGDSVAGKVGCFSEATGYTYQGICQIS